MTGDCSVFATESHPFVEKVMVSLGISWTVITVSVNDVDIKDNTYQTRRNVAESSGRVVKDYADKISLGEAFPMIVIEEKSPGRYRVVAGRHRASGYAEAQNGKSGYAAYLVDKSTPKEWLFALSARENNGNGVRQDNVETARYAASKMLEVPTPEGSRCHQQCVINSYAEAYGAHKNAVRDNYLALLVQREMMKVGVDFAGIPFTALYVLWKWTDSADWKRLASVVSENRSTPGITQVIKNARRDKLDASSLICRIEESAKPASRRLTRCPPIKDPATVTLEHLSLALNDLKDLAAPSNLPEEQAEDIASTVEAIRLACKQWKSR
jgi:hypothetical protein